MKVNAFLADAVSTRDSLLSVLGGGVTRLWRSEYPAPMNVDLALLLTVHPTEAAEPHRVRVLIQSADGPPEIARLEGEFSFGDPTPGPRGRQPGESLVLPLGLNLRQIAIPEPGGYSVEILVDNQHVDSLFFMVTPPPDEAAPSGENEPPPEGAAAEDAGD